MKRHNSPINDPNSQIDGNGPDTNCGDVGTNQLLTDGQSKRKKIQRIQPFSSLSQSALQAQHQEQERLRRLGFINDPSQQLPGIVNPVNARTKVPASDSLVIIDSSDEDVPPAISFKQPPSSDYHSSMSSQDGKTSIQSTQSVTGNLLTSNCIVIDSSSDEENLDNNSSFAGGHVKNKAQPTQNQADDDQSRRDKVKITNHFYFSLHSISFSIY